MQLLQAWWKMFNVLNMAMKVVGKQTFTYFKFRNRVTNYIGTDDSIFEAPVSVQGQVQAVPRNLYEIYGLDLQRTYLTFFISKAILDVERDVSGDQIQFGSERYQCLSETDWHAINGWTQVLAVKI